MGSTNTKFVSFCLSNTTERKSAPAIIGWTATNFALPRVIPNGNRPVVYSQVLAQWDDHKSIHFTNGYQKLTLQIRNKYKTTVIVSTVVWVSSSKVGSSIQTGLMKNAKQRVLETSNVEKRHFIFRVYLFETTQRLEQLIWWGLAGTTAVLGFRGGDYFQG